MNQYIENLKQSETVNRVKTEDGNIYGIRVLGRGENLFFQENDQALICQVDAVNSIIYTRSIKSWEGQKKMSQREKERVTALIEKYYQKVYSPNKEVILSDKNP